LVFAKFWIIEVSISGTIVDVKYIKVICRMKLILTAYREKSELLFTLVLDADTSIGVLMIFESDLGSTSGGISLDGSHAVYPPELKLLSMASRITAQFIRDSYFDIPIVLNETIDPTIFYTDSGGGYYSDKSYAGKLFVSAMLVQNLSGGIFFESSVVEKNEKATLKYDHIIEDVADPFIFVDLHF